MNLIERFVNYVQIDTESDPRSKDAPSTAKQLNLAKLLVDEMLAMGIEDDRCIRLPV